MSQDHDRTVREARENMADFDRQRGLERWLQNYVHPELGVPSAYWCTCIKVEKRWKIEYGLLSDTQAVAWCFADPGVPEPPILEFRKPKPEPVKPRFQVPKPRHVDAFDRLRAQMDAEFTKMFLYDTGTVNVTATEVAEGSTVAKMMDAIRNLPPELRQRDRVRLPVWRPVEFKMTTDFDQEVDAYKIDPVWGNTMLATLPPPELSEHVKRLLAGIDLAGLDKLDPPPPPAPEPSKRNQ